MSLSTPTPPPQTQTSGAMSIRAGAEFQFGNILVTVRPEGYLHIRFDRVGGSLEAGSYQQLQQFLDQLYPDDAVYAIWELMSTRPSISLRKAATDITPEVLRLVYVPVVVGPVGRMIIKFFRRVLGLTVDITTHETFDDAHAAVVKRMDEQGYRAPWVP